MIHTTHIDRRVTAFDVRPLDRVHAGLGDFSVTYDTSSHLYLSRAEATLLRDALDDALRASDSHGEPS